MANKIVELVNEWAQLEAENPDLDIETFCVQYLAKKAQMSEIETPYGMSLNTTLAASVGRLARYATLYTKKAVAPLGMASIDDFLYLILIFNMGNPRKSDVIHAALSEFPTGIDVIKRLVKLELVRETPDEEDKRSKRLQLTEKGQLMLMTSLEPTTKASDSAFNILTAPEKMILAKILQHLDHYHSNHYKETRMADSIEDIYTLLVPAKEG